LPAQKLVQLLQRATAHHGHGAAAVLVQVCKIINQRVRHLRACGSIGRIDQGAVQIEKQGPAAIGRQLGRWCGCEARYLVCHNESRADVAARGGCGPCPMISYLQCLQNRRNCQIQGQSACCKEVEIKPGREMTNRASSSAGNAMRLDGQSALVTGADTGLGRAIALELARAGANVAINYRANAAGAEEVAHAVEACGQKALVVQADVSDEDAVARLYQQAIDHFGTLHVSVSNAGLQRDVAFEDMTLAQWHAVLDVNLTGQFLCCRAAIREFLRRDVDPAVSCARGKIICMSSVHQAIPWAGHVNYAVSKG